MSIRTSARNKFENISNRTETIRENPGLLFILPTVALMVILITYPLMDTLRLSLYQVSSSQGQVFVGLTNYSNMLSSAWLPQVLLNTFVWVVGGVALQLIVGFSLALLLQTKFPGKGVIRAGFLIPWVTPTIVTAILFSWLYDSQFGIINGVLSNVGIIHSGISWLGNPSLALFAVIVTAVWKQFSFVMIMLLAGLQGIDRSVHQAAKLDGAPFFARLRHVTLPSLLPVLKIVILLSTIWMFNQFALIYTMTDGGPLGATTVLSVKVYRLAFQQFQYGPASTLSMLMILIMALFVYFYIRALRSRGVEL